MNNCGFPPIGEFSRHVGDARRVGHSLAPDFDQHILDALGAGEKRNYWIVHQKKQSHIKRRVAISMRAVPSGLRIIQEKTRLMQALPKSELEFFDSTTHPLGDPTLLVREEATRRIFHFKYHTDLASHRGESRFQIFLTTTGLI